MKDLIKKGEDLFSAGRIVEAEQVFNSIIERDFRSNEAHNNLGVIACQKGEIERAIDCFTRALQIDPDYRDALFNIADLLRKLGKISELAPFMREMAKAHELDSELLSLFKEAAEPAVSACGAARPEKENAWGGLWKNVRIEDILNEPSHQEIADNVQLVIPLNGRTVLEAGCGSGGTGMSLAQYGAKMTLIDISPESLELSNRLFQHQGLRAEFVAGDLFHLPFPDRSFDIVGSFGVLEHFKQQEIIAILREFRRVAIKDVVVTVPNARCAFYRIAKWFAEKTGTWQYGYEKPEFTMSSYMGSAGINFKKEYSIGFRDSLAFLRRIPNSSELVRISEDFEKENKREIDGSLLITFGEVAREKRVANVPAIKDQQILKFNPLVSVLMCVWNSEKFIGPAIESILAQTYKNFELVIADDGSTDHTKEIINLFDDPRVKYFYKEHSGLAKSRNFARANCLGEYSVIMDSDDLIHPEMLEKEVAAFAFDPEASQVVYAELELMGANGEKSETVWKYKNYEQCDIIPELFQAGKNVVPEASMMIPRALWQNTGEYNSEIRDSDNEFIARLARHTERFISVEEPLYRYRRHDGSMSLGSLGERALSSLTMLRKMLEIFHPEELFPNLKWKELDYRQKTAEFNFLVGQNLWNHCKTYKSVGVCNEFLKETVSYVNRAIETDPVHPGARTLARQISSVFPESKSDLKIKRVSANKVRTSLKVLYLADCRSQHSQRYARYFKNRGHDVHVFDVSGCCENLEGINLHFPHRTKTDVSYEDRLIDNVFSLNELIEKIKPDILHGHYITEWCWWGAMSGFQPFVITSWGSDIFLDPRDTFVRRFNSFCLKNSPLLTSDSIDLLNATCQLRGDSENVHYIPFGIDTKFFRPDYDSSGLAARIGAVKKRIVLSPRQFKPEANIHVLIEAIPKVLKIVPDTVFILKTYLTNNGAFSDYERKLHSMVTEKGLQDNVIFLQDIDFAEMPALYNLADVMVTLRDTDGSACAMLESMACNTPVIASNIGSMREWIRDGENGKIVNQHDPDSVAAAVIEILSNPQKSEKYKNKCLEIVRQRADYRKNWMDVEDLYHEILKGNTQTNYRAWNNIQGWSLLKAGNHDKAEKIFMKILHLSPVMAHDVLTSLLGLAKVSWLRGDERKSREFYSYFLRVLSNFELDSSLSLKSAEIN